MSVSVSIKGYSGKDSPEFQKHYKAVKFCIENKLSFPKETSEFFEGKVDGGDLDDYKPEAILEYIGNGVEVRIPKSGDIYGDGIRIKVKNIPSEVDEIVIVMR